MKKIIKSEKRQFVCGCPWGQYGDEDAKPTCLNEYDEYQYCEKDQLEKEGTEEVVSE